MSIACLTRETNVLTTVAIVVSMSVTSTISQGEWTVLVLAIRGMTTLSFHFFGSMWSSVRKVPVRTRLEPNSFASFSSASSDMFR